MIWSFFKKNYLDTYTHTHINKEGLVGEENKGDKMERPKRRNDDSKSQERMIED